MNKKTIIVGQSGGVDSAVSTVLLKEEGYNVIGATHFIWPESKCCSSEIFEEVKKFCGLMNISHYTIDLLSEFSDNVVGDFCQKYIDGKTPNPCVMCNRFVRFSKFYDKVIDILNKEKVIGINDDIKIATGHYAKIKKENNRYLLYRGKDKNKDQSYMLHYLTQNELKNIVFPLADLTKPEVRKIAEQKKLEYYQKEESQDICFVKGDYFKFIEEFKNIKFKSGNIVDTENNILGEHKGYINYTVGQRKGLNLNTGPYYVKQIIPEENKIIVDRKENIETDNFIVEKLNWIAFENIKNDIQCDVKTRYRSNPEKCKVIPIDNNKVKVILEKKTVISPGQSAVFYDNDLVLGGGFLS